MQFFGMLRTGMDHRQCVIPSDGMGWDIWLLNWQIGLVFYFDPSLGLDLGIPSFQLFASFPSRDTGLENNSQAL